MRFICFFLFLFLPHLLFGEPSVHRDFVLRVIHPELGSGFRHLAVAPSGVIYVRNRAERGIVALQDKDSDGSYEVVKEFSAPNGTGLRIKKGYLYYSTATEVLRFSLDEKTIFPKEAPEVIVRNLNPKDHGSKAIALDDAGGLYVNIGAPSNNCQKEGRTKGSLGLRPCPQLELSAGIWKFDATKLNQEFPKDGKRFVTGLRNAVAVRWNPLVSDLYLVQHGRDQLNQLFPQFYTLKESAELPAEEFHRVKAGANLGWPYTYFDQRTAKRMVAPEYGGDGTLESKTPKYQTPLLGFPGHWAPNDLLFYTGTTFPERFNGGAFIAFHGSWNRAPFPQEGFRVVFLPLKDGKPNGKYEDFMTGFPGAERLDSSGQAKYRPMGLAQGINGELIVLDSQKGRLWSIQKR